MWLHAGGRRQRIRRASQQAQQQQKRLPPADRTNGRIASPGTCSDPLPSAAHAAASSSQPSSKSRLIAWADASAPASSSIPAHACAGASAQASRHAAACIARPPCCCKLRILLLSGYVMFCMLLLGLA